MRVPHRARDGEAAERSALDHEDLEVIGDLFVRVESDRDALFLVCLTNVDAVEQRAQLQGTAEIVEPTRTP